MAYGFRSGFHVYTVFTIGFVLPVLFLLGLVVVVYGCVKGLLKVTCTNAFKRGYRLDGDRVFGLDVERVVFHTLLFWMNGVVFDRCLMVDY